VNDYPQAIVPVNQVEPVPRRIRAYLADRLVLDTTAALYVWEWPFYPQYSIPMGDIDASLLVDEHHKEHLRMGTAEQFGVRVRDVHRPGVAHRYSNSEIDGIVGTVRFDWSALDSWFEEDEEVFVHPRNPYTRVDALRSTRTVRVELDGTELARSASPVMVFETGLPTRYYFIAPRSTSNDSWAVIPPHPVRTRAHQRLLVSSPRGPGSPRRRLGLRLSDTTTAPHCRTDRLLKREGRYRGSR
jgi:uncharacterized protein (DUF427 family)